MRSILITLLATAACLGGQAHAADIKPMFCMLDHVDGAPNSVMFTEIFEADASDFQELGYANQFEATLREQGHKVHGEAVCHSGATRDEVMAQMQQDFALASASRRATETVAWKPSADGAALARLQRAPSPWTVLQCQVVTFNEPLSITGAEDLTFIFRDGNEADTGSTFGTRRALQVRAFQPRGPARVYDVASTLEQEFAGPVYRFPGLLARLLRDFPDGALVDLVDPATGGVLIQADTRGIPKALAEAKTCS